MVLAGLVALAVVAQVVITKSLIAEDTASPFQAVIWYATSVLNVVAIGRTLSKLFLWLYMTKLRPESYANYRHWGMEKEVENRVQAWLHIAMLPLLGLWSLWTLPIVITTLAPILAESIGFLDTSGQLTLVWLVAFFSAVAWVLQEHGTLDRKRQEFESLRPVYQRRFPVSELLSMYECLRVAPRIFWEEYRNLPDAQVNEATKQKFRERAAPYTRSGHSTFQWWAFAISVLAVFAAVGTFAEASINGGIVEWFVQGLSK